VRCGPASHNPCRCAHHKPVCGNAHHQFRTRSLDSTAAETSVSSAAVNAHIAKHIRAEFVTQRLLKFVTQGLIEFGCPYSPLAIVRRPARNANKFKAEGEPYKGQREYGRFHWSHQQLKL
jgi:hypothetical protein